MKKIDNIAQAVDKAMKHEKHREVEGKEELLDMTKFFLEEYKDPIRLSQDTLIELTELNEKIKNISILLNKLFNLFLYIIFFVIGIFIVQIFK